MSNSKPMSFVKSDESNQSAPPIQDHVSRSHQENLAIFGPVHMRYVNQEHQPGETLPEQERNVGESIEISPNGLEENDLEEDAEPQNEAPNMLAVHCLGYKRNCHSSYMYNSNPHLHSSFYFLDVVVVFAKQDFVIFQTLTDWLISLTVHSDVDLRILPYDSECFPSDEVSRVEDIVERASVVLMLLTPNFSAGNKLRFFNSEAIAKTRFETCDVFAKEVLKRKRYAVRPVHTQHENGRSYKTPSGLNCMKSIDFYDPHSDHTRESTLDVLLHAIKTRKYLEAHHGIPSAHNRHTTGNKIENIEKQKSESRKNTNSGHPETFYDEQYRASNYGRHTLTLNAPHSLPGHLDLCKTSRRSNNETQDSALINEQPSALLSFTEATENHGRDLKDEEKQHVQGQSVDLRHKCTASNVQDPTKSGQSQAQETQNYSQNIDQSMTPIGKNKTDQETAGISLWTKSEAQTSADAMLGSSVMTTKDNEGKYLESIPSSACNVPGHEHNTVHEEAALNKDNFSAAHYPITSPICEQENAEKEVLCRDLIQPETTKGNFIKENYSSSIHSNTDASNEQIHDSKLESNPNATNHTKFSFSKPEDQQDLEKDNGPETIMEHLQSVCEQPRLSAKAASSSNISGDDQKQEFPHTYHGEKSNFPGDGRSEGSSLATGECRVYREEIRELHIVHHHYEEPRKTEKKVDTSKGTNFNIIGCNVVQLGPKAIVHQSGEAGCLKNDRNVISVDNKQKGSGREKIRGPKIPVDDIEKYDQNISEDGELWNNLSKDLRQYNNKHDKEYGHKQDGESDEENGPKEIPKHNSGVLLDEKQQFISCNQNVDSNFIGNTMLEKSDDLISDDRLFETDLKQKSTTNNSLYSKEKDAEILKNDIYKLKVISSTAQSTTSEITPKTFAVKSQNHFQTSDMDEWSDLEDPLPVSINDELCNNSILDSSITCKKIESNKNISQEMGEEIKRTPQQKPDTNLLMPGELTVNLSDSNIAKLDSEAEMATTLESCHKLSSVGNNMHAEGEGKDVELEKISKEEERQFNEMGLKSFPNSTVLNFGVFGYEQKISPLFDRSAKCFFQKSVIKTGKDNPGTGCQYDLEEPD